MWPGATRPGRARSARRGETAPAGPEIADRRGDGLAGPPQLRDPGVDPLDDRVQSPPLALTGGRAEGVGAQRVDDLLQRDPELLELPRHPDPLHRGLRVLPVARRPPPGWRKDPPPLVEPDGVDGDAGPGSDLTDLHDNS